MIVCSAVVRTATLLVFLLQSSDWPVARQTLTKGEIVAEVDGVAITAAELEMAVGAQLAKLQEQIYNVKRQKIEALIDERLLAREAAKRGTGVHQLLDAEVASKVELVTEQEIKTFYEANKNRLQGEETALRKQIRGYLQNQKSSARREAFVRSLRSQVNIGVHLTPPPVLRVEVGVDGAPFRGPASAAVTIVEFSDFHCPFCKKVQSTLTEVLSRYPDKVKLVYRDAPIDSLHPHARKAAEAAQCAHEEGRFWAYHDKLYAREPDASLETLKAIAAEVGMDVAAFERCFRAGKYQFKVQKDVEEGSRLGVTGTPAFFINGRLLSGAQSAEIFARMIEEELARRP
jgi:protein-disulfide isomerase